MSLVISGGLLVSTDGWPLTYPAWVSTLDRRRIDDALSAAATSATLPATPATAPARPLTGPVHGRLFASEGAALEAVLQVFTVVVRVLSTPRDGGPDEDTRRRVADQLFDELVVWIADLTPAVTAGDLADRAYDARETCAWWTEAFAAPEVTPRPAQDLAADEEARAQALARLLVAEWHRTNQDRSHDESSQPAPTEASVEAVPVPAPLDDDSPLLTLQEAAERLSKHDDTVKRMGDRGEIRIIRVGKRLMVPLAEVKRILADPYR